MNILHLFSKITPPAIRWRQGIVWQTLRLSLIIVIALAAAMAVRLALTQQFGPGLATFITFYPAIIVIALLAGFWPGLVTTLLASIVIAIYILPPIGHLAIEQAIDQISLILFLIMGGGISWFAEASRLYRGKALDYDLEHKLAANEERWRFAMETANLGAWELKSADAEAWRSLRHDQIFGYAELLPKWTYHDFLQHVPEEDRAEVDTRYQQAVALHQDLSFECRIRRTDGKIRWIWVRGKFMSDDHLFGVVGDITERKQSEEVQRRLALMVESSQEAIIGKTLEKEIISWNAASTGLFGYTAEEAIGRPITILFPHDRLDEEERIQAKLLQGESVSHYETVRLRKDGEPIDISITVSPIFDDTGQIIGASKIARDITERKRVERELQQSQKDLAIAQAVGRIGSWRLDVRKNILTWSTENYRIFGIQEGTPLTYQSFLNCVHPDDRAFVDASWAAALRKEPYEIEHRIIVDGQVKWLHEKAELEFDENGELMGGFGISQDITEHKQYEEALTETQERNRLATETTGIGIWEWNVMTNEIRWDNEMFRIYGITTALGGLVTYQTWSESVFPEDFPQQNKILHDTVQRRGRSQREFRIIKADSKELRYIQAMEMVRVNSAGQADWVVGTNLDITERKQAEAGLLDANRRKDEFLAMLGHELRNPLTPIMTAAEILQSLTSDEPTFDWVRNVLQRNARQIKRLVDDLLDVSRITRGLVNVHLEQTDLRLILQQAIESAQALIESKQQTYSIDIPEQELMLNADPLRLIQVFSNLLNNAAKYTGAGGHIAICVTAEPLKLIVCLRDNGIGIAPELKPYLFDLFTQGQRSLARTEGGLGIGLTLVKKLVELHGGQVIAESPGIGQGSTFTVELPRFVDDKH